MSAYDADDEEWDRTDLGESGDRYVLDSVPDRTPTRVDVDGDGVRGYGPFARGAFEFYRASDYVAPDVDEAWADAVEAALHDADGDAVAWGVDAGGEGALPRVGYASVRAGPGLVATAQLRADEESERGYAVDAVDYAVLPKLETVAERADNWYAYSSVDQISDPSGLPDPFGVDLTANARRVEGEVTTITTHGGSYHLDRVVLAPHADLVDERDHVVDDHEADGVGEVRVVTPDEVDEELERLVAETAAGSTSVAALSSKLDDFTDRIVDDLADRTGDIDRDGSDDNDQGVTG